MASQLRDEPGTVAASITALKDSFPNFKQTAIKAYNTIFPYDPNDNSRGATETDLAASRRALQSTPGVTASTVKALANGITALPAAAISPSRLPTDGITMLPSHGSNDSQPGNTASAPLDHNGNPMRIGQSITFTPSRRSAARRKAPLSGPATQGNPSLDSSVAGTATTPVIAAPMASAQDRTYEYKVPGVTDLTEQQLAAGLSGDNAAFDASRKQNGIGAVPVGLTADEIKNYQIADNGGIATMDGRTFVLPARGLDEENKFQAQNTGSAQPAAPITAPLQQATTYGDSTGVYQLAPGQNPPRDWSKADITDIYSAKINSKLNRQAAETRQADAAATHYANQDAMGISELPAKIDLQKAQTRNYNTLSDTGIAVTPYNIAYKRAETDRLNLGIQTDKELLPLIKQEKQADIRSRNAATDLSLYKASPEGMATAKQVEDQKDFKSRNESNYKYIQNLSLPQGFEGQDSQLANMLTQHQDQASGTGIYFNPGTPARAGIFTRRDIFEPLLNGYIAKGYPEADAYAAAFGALKALGNMSGQPLYKPFPALGNLPRRHTKADDTAMLYGN